MTHKCGMNSLKHYVKLIRRGQNRTLTGRTDQHHIFPKSIFGENDGLVPLTEREHFVAHLLLWDICKKRYGPKHSHTLKMGSAIYLMGNKNSYFYEEWKAQNRQLLSKPETREKMSKSASAPKPHKQGCKFWNNGVKNVMSKEKPEGDEWVRGRLPYTRRPYTRVKPSAATRAIWSKQRKARYKTLTIGPDGRFTKTS